MRTAHSVASNSGHDFAVRIALAKRSRRSKSRIDFKMLAALAKQESMTGTYRASQFTFFDGFVVRGGFGHESYSSVNGPQVAFVQPQSGEFRHRLRLMGSRAIPATTSR